MMHQGSSLCILSVIEMASVGARQRQEGCVESNWIVNLFQSCGPARVEEHEKNSEEHQAASRGVPVEGGGSWGREGKVANANQTS